MCFNIAEIRESWMMKYIFLKINLEMRHIKSVEAAETQQKMIR